MTDDLILLILTFLALLAMFTCIVLLGKLIKEIIKMASNQGLTDLQAALAAETVQSALVVTTLQGLGSQITALTAQVASLQAQLAAGTEVTDAQLESFAQGLDAAQASVAAALPAPAAPVSTDAAKKS
jgi:hypothetical protein